MGKHANAVFATFGGSRIWRCEASAEMVVFSEIVMHADYESGAAGPVSALPTAAAAS